MITCYSPVRHSTHYRSSFRVRLACLIHAANVRSEPGSNPSLEKFFPLFRSIQSFPECDLSHFLKSSWNSGFSHSFPVCPECQRSPRHSGKPDAPLARRRFEVTRARQVSVTTHPLQAPQDKIFLPPAQDHKPFHSRAF